MPAIRELLSNPQSVGKWNLVPERSQITFRNKTMWGAMKVHGAFLEFSGEGQITDTKTVSGRIDIKAASLTTKLHKRDEDLRSPTFLDVQRHPNITVVATSAEPVGDNTVDIKADLTVKGTTAPMPLRAKVEVLDDGAARLTGHTTVNRKDWGVTGNMLGMVGDKTTLTADLVFERATG